MDPPDYTSDIYAAIRQDLALALDMTEEEAAEHLANTWRQRNRRNGEHPEQPPPQPPRLPQIQPEEDRDPEPPRAPEGRKNVPQIDLEESIPASRLPDPSEQALRKLRNFEYVELWYFTPKGCEVAAAHAVSLDADTFTISKSDANFTLLPARTSSLPKNAIIQDQHLLSTDMAIAKNNLIAHMERCGWPDNVVRMFMRFYMKLDTHPIRSQPQGDQALIIYQAEARRDWHRTLAVNKNHKVYNLARIRDSRLQEIADEIRIATHNRLISVSRSFP